MSNDKTDVPDIFACLTREERNEAIGAGIDAWLDKKWMSFSKWTIRGLVGSLLTAAFAGCAHLVAQHWRQLSCQYLWIRNMRNRGI